MLTTGIRPERYFHRVRPPVRRVWQVLSSFNWSFGRESGPSARHGGRVAKTAERIPSSDFSRRHRGKFCSKSRNRRECKVATWNGRAGASKSKPAVVVSRRRIQGVISGLWLVVRIPRPHGHVGNRGRRGPGVFVEVTRFEAKPRKPPVGINRRRAGWRSKLGRLTLGRGRREVVEFFAIHGVMLARGLFEEGVNGICRLTTAWSALVMSGRGTTNSPAGRCRFPTGQSHVSAEGI